MVCQINRCNNKTLIFNLKYHLISLNMLMKRINKELRPIQIMFSIMADQNSKASPILNNLLIKALEAAA